jgi:F-type H+-transporting ATPase subunit b
MLAKRRQFINEELYSAEQANRESFIKLSEAEQTRINAYSDAKMIIENARNEAYMDKENIQSETKILVKKMLEDAKNNGIKLQNQIRQTMNDQILDIAMTATEALLQKKVNKKENEKFVKQAIDNIKVLGGEDDR